MRSKVFCLGFHKTGTKSMAFALKELGYRVTGPNGVQDPDIATNVLAMAFGLVPKFDAFRDNPWPVIYRELDAAFPRSKFVLLLRDPVSWINSQVQHFGRNETPMRKWIYGVGCPQGNEQIYLERFNAHNADVQVYFKDRPQDLLVMNLAGGDGWEKLCPFLETKILTTPFPHANKGVDRQVARAAKERSQSD
jgi:hypothetical protein